MLTVTTAMTLDNLVEKEIGHKSVLCEYTPGRLTLASQDLAYRWYVYTLSLKPSR
jgi:hypothetical protein